MCTVNDGSSFFRPMTMMDIAFIATKYNELPRQLLYDLYEAMTDHNTVLPAVMLVILESLHRLKSGHLGASAYGAVFAYSALQIKDGGDGNIFHRYQDPIMSHIHDAMLQFALAERNMRKVQEVLRRYQYDFVHFCDCGCITTVVDVDFMETEEYKAVNLIRSYGESIGAPVHQVKSIDDLPLHLTDMHPHEVAGYKKIWGTLQMLPVHPFEGTLELSQAFEYLTSMKEGSNAGSGRRSCINAVGAKTPVADHAAR